MRNGSLRAMQSVLMVFATLVLGPESLAAQTADAEPEIIALDDAWIAAEVQHDRAALERILDERFLLTSASGRTLDRTAFIDMILQTDIKPFAVVHEVIEIHGDVALVIDRSTDGTSKYTWVVVRKQGQWRVISETMTNVAPPR